MFQPSGPNFLLSWTIAWKKVSPIVSLPIIYCNLKSSKKFAGSWLRDLSMFAFNPRGGSVVTFVLF